MVEVLLHMVTSGGAAAAGQQKDLAPAAVTVTGGCASARAPVGAVTTGCGIDLSSHGRATHRESRAERFQGAGGGRCSTVWP